MIGTASPFCDVDLGGKALPPAQDLPPPPPLSTWIGAFSFPLFWLLLFPALTGFRKARCALEGLVPVFEGSNQQRACPSLHKQTAALHPRESLLYL